MQLTRLKWLLRKGQTVWDYESQREDPDELLADKARVIPYTTIFGDVRYRWHVERYDVVRDYALVLDVNGNVDTPLTAMLAAEDALLGPLPLRLEWKYRGSLHWACYPWHDVSLNVRIRYALDEDGAEQRSVFGEVRRPDAVLRTRVSIRNDFNTIHEAQLWAEEQLLGPIPAVTP